MTMIYAAAPYSAIEDKSVLMRELSRQCGLYMLSHPGEYVVPGLLHHWPACECPELGTDYEFWQDWCETLIGRCDRMIVFTFDGWRESVGVQAEIRYATDLGMSVEYVDLIV